MPVTLAVPKVAGSITDRIAHRRNVAMPLMLKFMPKHPSGAKSGSHSERLVTMKNNKVDSGAKVV